mmetsp:Transcript_26666/g.50687  ORF Transcript_26666/g.50687 Transcript_26666/m.50687 type:complete len:212 (-) Transcript_26666:251-886(-)
MAVAGRGMAYTLRNYLYVALTNETPACSLMASRGPGFKMPPSSGFEPLPQDGEPTAEQVFAIVEDAYKEDGEVPEGVVYGGLGDPLLRLTVVQDSARLIKAKRHGVGLRVTTCGLVAPQESYSVAQTLWDCGVKHASVSLNTADPKQYMQMMQPTNGLGHSEVCTFITLLAEVGVKVTCTAVERPEVDIAATRSLGMALGAVDFRSRSYHP